MNHTQVFSRHLAEQGQKQAYIAMSKKLLDSFYSMLGEQPPSSAAIDRFVRSRWSGYVSRDKETYKILYDYAGFCETEWPAFSDAFREHIRDTFEGEARKAMKIYKNAIVFIPKDAKINSSFLYGLSNDEFVVAFKSLQELICAIYDEIGRSSPFDWGWPDWKAITWEGLNHNRVMMVLDALVGSGHLDGDTLAVDKKRFNGYGICKPIANTMLMLGKFVDRGFRIDGLENKKSLTFTVSYPDTPNLISVLCSYFKSRLDDCKNHVRVFSYRFVEDPSAQTREPFFLAKTDGEPSERREIYYWLYDEAVKHGFFPMGCENMGCYVYKKGKEEWLLLGGGSSYHEDEFLHSPSYGMAAKVRFYRVFQTHPEKIENLRKRFPDSFGRPWTQCCKCKANADECKKRVSIDLGSRIYYHCGARSYFYFHDPNFDDVKAIFELYKLENNVQ